jgi:endonuclease-3
MTPNGDPQGSQTEIASLLLANRGEGTDWGEFADPAGIAWSKNKANKFLLGNLLDYQIPSELVWRNADRLIEHIPGDPDDLWGAITSVSEAEWKAKREEYRPHRFPAGHNRLWSIGKRICDRYDGDSRRIWEEKGASVALDALWDIGAGEQISRMIVGALRDCHQITGVGDVKADTYVRRVLGRALLGDTTDPGTAIRLSRQMHPADPWQLDAQLWSIGRNYCRPTNPDCPKCYLIQHCSYARRYIGTGVVSPVGSSRQQSSATPQKVTFTVKVDGTTVLKSTSMGEFLSSADSLAPPSFATQENRTFSIGTLVALLILIISLAFLVLKFGA